MPSCLGIYLEDSLIKYAKVSKEHDIIKVEASGVKFFDRKVETLKQIINETFSYKIPISINLSGEKYNYFQLFSLLNKKDLDKAVETEFEYFCEERGFNKNVLESRYLFTKNLENKDKITALYMYANKTELARKLQEFDNYKLSTITPLPIAVTNLLEVKNKQNSVIVNIEEKTTVTTIIDGEIYRINEIEQGMNNIFNNINLKENSYQKAYEICKNATIYTMEGQNLQVEENEYLEDIMPTLYNIVIKVKELISNNLFAIDNLYITGTGAVINNIDLYFQEYLQNTKCEVLKPYFVNKDNIKINVKDYIEVNSAISLALQGLGEGIKSVNFRNNSLSEKINNILSMNVEFGGNKKDKNKIKSPTGNKISFDFSLKGSLDRIEKWLLRVAGGILLIIILYSLLAIVLNSQINDTKEKVQEVIDDTNIKISQVDLDITQLKTKSSEYSRLIKNLEELNAQITDKYSYKNLIPNLLYGIMFSVPTEVQITSIENNIDKHIVITAQAEKYEDLGYFKTKLSTEEILLNVTSNIATKQNGIVSLTIEGDLP